MTEEMPQPSSTPVEGATPANQTPRLILWAFITSLFGIFCIPSIAAIVMAAVGWKQVKTSGKGQALAITAVAISTIWIVFIAIAAINAPEMAEKPTVTEKPAASESVEATEDAVDTKATEREPSQKASPDPTPESDVARETVGYKLAAIDGKFDRTSVELYERRVAQVAGRCKESESSVGDKVVKATQILDQRGITESNLWVMDSVLQAIPPNEAGTLDCTEVIVVLITLRINQ